MELTARPATHEELAFHKTMLAHYEERMKALPRNWLIRQAWKQHRDVVTSKQLITSIEYVR